MDGKVIIDLRNFKRLVDIYTREEIARGVSCDTSLVTKHYNGDRNITLGYAIKYSQFFGVSIDYLVGRTNEKLFKEEERICNIGDTLYSVGSVTQDIVELTVEGIQITKKDTFIFCHGGIYVSVSQQLNKSVFRTCEEAEDYRGRLKNEHTT